MPRLTEQQLDAMVASRNRRDMSPSGVALRGIDRAVRLGELAAGTLGGAMFGGTPGLGRWFPDVYEKGPEAFGAFYEQAKTGDVDAAIGAYQEAMDAGKYYWGVSGVPGALLPTGVPFAAGRGLLGAATRLSRGGRVQRAAAPPVEMVGKVLRAPWQAEVALEQQLIEQPVRAAFRRLRGRRPVTPPVPGARAADDIMGAEDSYYAGLKESLEDLPGRTEVEIGGKRAVFGGKGALFEDPPTDEELALADELLGPRIQPERPVVQPAPAARAAAAPPTPDPAAPAATTRAEREWLEDVADDFGRGPEVDIAGEETSRVVWGVKSGDTLKTSSLDNVGYSEGPATLRGIHVGDPDFWKKQLADDYGRDPADVRTITIRAIDGDALLPDRQYAIPPEFGEMGSANVLVTKRTQLEYGKDWVFEGENFAPTPTPPTPTAAPAAPGVRAAVPVEAVGRLGPEEVRKIAIAANLPGYLTKSAPRWGLHQLAFESDIDKALFIISQKTPSVANAQFLRWLSGYIPDRSKPELEGIGQNVREHIRKSVLGHPPDAMVRIPWSGATDLVKPGPPKRTRPPVGTQQVPPQQRPLAGGADPPPEDVTEVFSSKDAMEVADPSGSGANRAPGTPGGEVTGDADALFEELKLLADPGELKKIKKNKANIIQTLLRRHMAAINEAEIKAKTASEEGEKQFRALGLSVGRGGREIIREEAIPEIDALFRSLHNEGPIPPRLVAVYYDLIEQTDYEQAFRIDFDIEGSALTNDEAISDYFYRGWRMSDKLLEALRLNGPPSGRVGWPPGFTKPRVGATYTEMRDADFEPLSWNPYEMVRISRMQGVRYRQQMMLLDHLKRLGLAQPSAGGGPGFVEGVIDSSGKPWRVPKIGPAFQGKPLTVADEIVESGVDESLGEPVAQFRKSRYLVPGDVAKRLELIYGEPLTRLEPLEIGRWKIEPLKVIDALVFIPKRAKLMFSVFQQYDFLSRSLNGTWHEMVDEMLAGRPVEAGRALWRWPMSARKLIQANLSPDYRVQLKKELASKEPLVPVVKGAREGHTRSGVHLEGIMQAGLSLFDRTLLPANLGEIATSAAEDAGLLHVKAVGRVIKQMEDSMRRGLFDGVYPAAQITDIKNNVANIMVRKFGDMSDDAINGAIARYINVKYSTIPPEQSVIQTRWLREIFQRLFFSVGESEGLLRQAVYALPLGKFGSPYAAVWRKYYLGAYLALLSTANAIHFMSTGKPLPFERWVPITTDTYGKMPVGYRRDFMAPTIPLKGRSETEITLDLVGQMDTALRILDPIGFLAARESVPIRAGWNQITGEDFYGASITAVGPLDGIVSRIAAALSDMFAPIGPGQAGIGVLRETVPAVARILPPGEERLGVVGELLQAPGFNVRAETTPHVRRRMARASGFKIEPTELKRLGKQSGAMVTEWEHMTPAQQDRAVEMSGMSEEFRRRQEVGALRGQEYAQSSVARRKRETELVGKLQSISRKWLEEPLETGRYVPENARNEVNKAVGTYYTAVYGDIWDEEKQRFTGGIYDPDEPMEPAEEGVRGLLAEYRKLFEIVRDPDTKELDFSGEAGDAFAEAEAEFWGALSEDEVRILSSNMHRLEAQFPEPVRKMQDAKRYAATLRVDFGGGEFVRYWDLNKHPVVMQSVVDDIGRTDITSADVLSYLRLNRPARKAAEVTEPGKAIGDAYRRSTREDGLLWELKNYFFQQSPEEWKRAMVDAGYDYPLKQATLQALVPLLQAGGKLDPIDYRSLYMGSLQALSAR
jgi:hypothetical protein